MRIRILPLAGLAALLLAGGCSSDGGAWGEYFQIMRQSIGASFHKTSVGRDQAASIPYASLGYRINGGNEGILVLATDSNGEQLWTAASHVVLLTRGGRVLRSVGLPHDIAGTMAQGGTLPPLSDALRGPYRSTRTVDLPDIGAYGVSLNCTTTARGPQAISIIGTTINTVRIDETCRSNRPYWSFTDNYWIDAKTGFTWHSIQHLHPVGTTIQIEVFRPPV
jgi:hypothetical protein